MRTLGLIGGMTWQSTALYYRLLNEFTEQRLGGLHSVKLVLHSVDFAELAELQHADRWDDAGTLVAEAAQGLQAAGAQLLLIGANTMHLVADRVAAAVDVPLLHVADVVARAARADGVTRLGLLGTAFTMQHPFYADRLRAHGLHVTVPEDDDRALVHRVIYTELAKGVFSDESRQALLAIVSRLAEGGAQAVVLGCTELELLLTEGPVPLYPTTRLHCEAAVTAALD
ncbi:MAG: amino acid racemase [Kineosporiaceae bacterium]